MHQAVRSLIVFFVLILVAIPLISQSDSPVYARLSYMKVAPGQADAYVRMEREVWKPIHEARLEAGIITGWQLYRVEYPSGTDAEYDYVVVSNFDDFAKTTNDFPASVFEAAYPGADEQRIREIGEEALAMRDLVRTELLIRREGLPSTGPATYLLLGKMSVPPGGNTAYLGLERDIWKPIHQAVQDAGASAGWSVWQMLFPGGTREPYNFLAVNFYANYEDVDVNFSDFIQTAHPSVTDAGWAAMLDRTLEVREGVQRELWERIEQVSPNQ